MNLVLITLDTLRADHLGCYGYGKPTSPVLDELAGRSTLFEYALSQSAVTPVSHASILTGLNPYHHGLRSLHGGRAYALPPERVTLAEIMKDKGYRTAGFVSAFPVTRYYGLHQGFETWDEAFEGHDGKGLFTDEGILYTGNAQRRGDRTARAAMDWMEKNRQARFFVWVHFFDVHDTHLVPPQLFLSRFPPHSLSEQGLLLATYDAEINFVDEQIGRVLKTLEEIDALDNTVVAIVGDHGEGLGEHNWWGHAILYEEQLHVPLIVHIPGGPAPRRVGQMVRTVDLFPTIVELFGRDSAKSEQGADGRSLVPLLNGQALEPALAYAESLNDLFGYIQTPFDHDSLYSLNDSNWKLIVRRDGAQDKGALLFDLKADPDEQINRIGASPERAARLRQLLDGLGAVEDRKLTPGLDQEAMERLRALGYVQ